MEASAHQEDFELQEITHDGVSAAVKMAEHYRLLQQPALARSICLDVLEVEPDNQQAIVTLILALTDQFAESSSIRSPRAAREHLEKLTDEYQRLYYGGIIFEREARASLRRGPARGFAYGGFRQAIELFERAAAIRPAGNDHAILRRNACIRSIREWKLEPPVDESPELGLE